MRFRGTIGGAFRLFSVSSASSVVGFFCFLSASAIAQNEEQSVPFAVIESIVVTKGTINGRDALWVVDTGSNHTIITPAAARKAGLDGGERTVSTSIGAGDAVVKDLRVVVDDPQVVHFMRDAGVDYDGILGTTFFERFLFTLDYPNKRMTFAPPDSKPPGGSSVPFELKNGLIFVEAGVEGKGTLKLLFDCGAQAVLIRPKAAGRLGIEGRPSPRPELRWARLDYMRVGDVAVGPLDAAILEHEQAVRVDPEATEFAGLLGYNFLARLKATIDYRKKTIYLDSSAAREIKPAIEAPPEKEDEPVKPAPEPSRPALGITLMETCVTEVEAGSPAAKAGFRIGDVIVSIDGQDVQLVEEVRAIVTASKPGSKLAFKVRRGKKDMSITLAW